MVWLVRMELKALVGGLFLSLLVLWNVFDCVQTHQDETETETETGESSCQSNTRYIVTLMCAALHSITAAE